MGVGVGTGVQVGGQVMVNVPKPFLYSPKRKFWCTVMGLEV